MEQSIVMSENYGIQGDESEVDGRNSNQVNKDISNNRNSEERNNRMKMNQQAIIVMTKTMKKNLVKSTVR